MPGLAQNSNVIRFGVFEVNLQAGELRKSGAKIKLQEQPFQILALLLEHPGQVVTREELQQRLWPADTFVEFDNGLNTAIKKLREALGDSADNPRFVETLPRRGYRLIVPVASDPAHGQSAEERLLSTSAKQESTRRLLYFGVTALGVIAVGVTLWKVANQTPNLPRVLSFKQLTNDGQVKTGPLVTDGSRIYFNETLPGPHNLIAQVAIAGGEVVPLSVQLKEPHLFDLSKEQTELLIGSGDGTTDPALWIQSVAGGSPRRVGTILAGDACFGPSGIVYNHGFMHDVYAANRDGSGSRKIISTDGEPSSCGYSPDAKTLRFSQADDQRDLSTIVETAAGGTGLHKLFAGCCGKWTPDGKHYLFERKRDGRTDLWALSETEHFRWGKQAEPIQLTAGPMNFTLPLPSADGKQLFAIGESPRAEVVRYDSRTGQFVPYLSGISADGLAFSRDGQWVAYTSYPDGTLWRSRVDGSERLQLTFLPLRAYLPRWSSDGKQIAFNGSTPDTGWNIYLIAKDGGTPDRVFPSEESQMDATWSSDGNALAFGTTAMPNMPIYTIDLKSRHVSALPGSANLFSPRWSPDGKYIAAIASDRPHKLVVFEFATQKWTELFGFDIGYLSWSHDSKYIYFQHRQNPDQNISVHIARIRVADRKIENIVEERNAGRLITGTFPDWFDLAPDDSPLFARDISTQEIYALDVQWP